MRKKIARYVFRNYGTSVVCSEPIFGNEQWRTQLGVLIHVPCGDGPASSVHISGLGELVFDKHLEFVSGITREQLEANLQEVMVGLFHQMPTRKVGDPDI